MVRWSARQALTAATVCPTAIIRTPHHTDLRVHFIRVARISSRDRYLEAVDGPELMFLIHMNRDSRAFQVHWHVVRFRSLQHLPRQLRTRTAALICRVRTNKCQAFVEVSPPDQPRARDDLSPLYPFPPKNKMMRGYYLL